MWGPAAILRRKVSDGRQPMERDCVVIRGKASREGYVQCVLDELCNWGKYFLRDNNTGIYRLHLSLGSLAEAQVFKYYYYWSPLKMSYSICSSTSSLGAKLRISAV